MASNDVEIAERKRVGFVFSYNCWINACTWYWCVFRWGQELKFLEIKRWYAFRCRYRTFNSGKIVLKYESDEHTLQRRADFFRNVWSHHLKYLLSIIYYGNVAAIQFWYYVSTSSVQVYFATSSLSSVQAALWVPYQCISRGPL